jgi:hypothetical protein
MSRRKMLCQAHEQGESAFGNSLAGTKYFAVARCDVLPRAVRREDHVIVRGYAVGFGQWFFFDALEPAVAFGRAARMSYDCRGYGVYEAAQELQFCDIHDKDEIVLLVNVAGGNLDRTDDEVETLKRFVQGVKEHPWSAHWHEPTGYITDYNNGRPAKTRRKSLPL